MMTGSSGLICLILSRIWMPSIPGRRKSRRTSSMEASFTLVRASSPELTDTTEWFSSSRTLAMAQIMSGSSSTTNILAMREEDIHCCSLSLGAVHCDFSVMGLKDPFGHGEADSDRVGLGGIKRGKNFGEVSRMNPRAVVLDGDGYRFFGAFCLHQNASSVGNGLHRI